MKDFFELETQGWNALSSEGDAGKKFYDSILRDDAIMIFPGNLVIEGKQNILESLSTRPWSSFRIKELKVVSLSDDTAVFVYRVTARRGGSDPYEALACSTYAFADGKWNLVVHQQTSL